MVFDEGLERPRVGPFDHAGADAIGLAVLDTGHDGLADRAGLLADTLPVQVGGTFVDEALRDSRSWFLFELRLRAPQGP